MFVLIMLLVLCFGLAVLDTQRIADDLPSDMFTGETNLFLNIGGVEPNDGPIHWLNVNAQNVSGNTDIIRETHDLFGFRNDSVACIYASHILEHVNDNQTLDVLLEWKRVLRPGGLLLISVPDMNILAAAFLRPDVTLAGKRLILNMIYGAGSQVYDYHRWGFDHEGLQSRLTEAGYCNSERIGRMDYFPKDCSTIAFADRMISLNIAAHKCSDDSGFYVSHNAQPYSDEPHRFVNDKNEEVPWRSLFSSEFFKDIEP